MGVDSASSGRALMCAVFMGDPTVLELLPDFSVGRSTCGPLLGAPGEEFTTRHVFPCVWGGILGRPGGEDPLEKFLRNTFK